MDPNRKLPDRWKKKQFEIERQPRNQGNGYFASFSYVGDPFKEVSHASFAFRSVCGWRRVDRLAASARTEDRFWNKTLPVSYVVPAPRLLPPRPPSRPSPPPPPLELLPPLLPSAPAAPVPVRPHGPDPRLEILKKELALDEKNVERLERKVAVFQIRAARFERELGDARAEIDSLNEVVQALAALVAKRRRP